MITQPPGNVNNYINQMNQFACSTSLTWVFSFYFHLISFIKLRQRDKLSIEEIVSIEGWHHCEYLDTTLLILIPLRCSWHYYDVLVSFRRCWPRSDDADPTPVMLIPLRWYWTHPEDVDSTFMGLSFTPMLLTLLQWCRECLRLILIYLFDDCD